MDKTEHKDSNVKEEFHMEEIDLKVCIFATFFVSVIMGVAAWNQKEIIFENIEGPLVVLIGIIFFLWAVHYVRRYIKCKKEDSFYKSDKKTKTNVMVEQQY